MSKLIQKYKLLKVINGKNFVEVDSLLLIANLAITSFFDLLSY